MIKKKNNYVDPEYISDVIYNYMNFRKKENEIVEIISSVVKHLQSMPKFSGYPYYVHDDMMQVSMFNFFNNIHDIKFSRKKISKIIKLKNTPFFEKYEKENILKEFAGQQFFCHDISECRKKLLCYLIDQKLTSGNIEETNNIVLNENQKIKKVTIRINATEFKDFFVVVNIDKTYEIEYNLINFNFFSFITQIVVTSFTQVLNKENDIKEVNQVIIWEKTKAYKFDTNDINIQSNVINAIKTVSQNFLKKKKRR